MYKKKTYESITFEPLTVYEKMELCYQDHISSSNLGYFQPEVLPIYYSDYTNLKCSNIQVQNHTFIIRHV